MSSAKLTMEQVRELRERYVEGELTYVEIAEEFGLSVGAITGIVTNRVYKDPAYVPKRRPRKSRLEREREARRERMAKRWDSDPDWRSKLGTYDDDME